MLRCVGRMILVLAVSGALGLAGGRVSASVLAQGAQPYRLVLPRVMRQSAGSPTGGWIIDHTTANLAAIPTQYLTLAKSQLRLSYGHTSHGSQLISGAEYWFGQNAALAFNTNGANRQPGPTQRPDPGVRRHKREAAVRLR